MSPEEAEAKLRETREKMFGGEAGMRDIDPRAMRERYAQLEERIAAAVESGRITREQGAARLAQAKERLMEASRAKDAGEEQADMRARRMRYAEYEKGIKARVEKGAMSPEEAEAKLRETREKMFGGDESRKLDPKARKKAGDSVRGKGVDEGSMKARYAEYERRLDAAVKKGEMTAEQARAKLAEARKKMFGE